MANVIALRPKSGTAPKRELLKVTANAGQGRRSDREYGRTRSHLTPDEVAVVIDAARKVGRHTLRDQLMLLMGYRHGLRVSELTDLKWAQVDFRGARLHVTRLKKGTPATHPIEGDELRLLRRLRKETEGSFVFATERGGPISRTAVNKLVQRAGQRAGILFRVTPHMLRHSTGYALANRDIPTRTIQAYLGHRSITHTTRYTALSEGAFKNLWR
jgi:integrase